MCRYTQYGPYKDHYACFACRKAFKIKWVHEWPDHLRPPDDERPPSPCPDCGQPMADMGLDFKAPKKSDVKQWRKVEILFQHGFTYHSCGCCGPGLRPSELRDVDAFIAGNLSKSDGALLLEKIAENVQRRQQAAKHKTG